MYGNSRGFSFLIRLGSAGVRHELPPWGPGGSLAQRKGEGEEVEGPHFVLA